MVSEADKAYAAGFIDGEGTIGLYRRKRYVSRFSYVPCVSATGTVRAPIDWLKNVWGGGVYTKKTQDEKRRVAYRWEVGPSGVVSFLEAVLPYLKIKQEQATVLLDYMAKRPDLGLTRTGRRRTVAEGAEAYQEEVYLKLRALKQSTEVLVTIEEL